MAWRRGGRGAHPGDQEQRHEKTNAANRLGKLVVVHRLLDVAAAAELVAALDFADIVRRGQHDHGNLAQVGIRLQAAQHFDAVHLRHLQIHEHDGRLRIGPAGERAAAKQIIERVGPVAQGHDFVGEVVFFQRVQRQFRVARTVVHQQNAINRAHGDAGLRSDHPTFFRVK